MKNFNIKKFSREINFPYHSLLRILHKYKCTTKEELLKSIDDNKKFHVGDRFGKVVIISENTILKNSQTHVEVRCDCGNTYYVPLTDLKKGRRRACTKCRAISRRIPINVGDSFGKWVVISGPHSGITKNSVVYLCECSCGNTQYCNAHDLKTGRTTRCFKCSRKVGIDTMTFNNGRIGDLTISKYNKIKNTASKRGIEFNVSMEYLWNLFIKQNKRCSITGDAISEFRKASLDRINSSFGYIENNVQWVTAQANLSKHKMTMNELYDFCKKVLKHANQQPS